MYEITIGLTQVQYLFTNWSQTAMLYAFSFSITAALLYAVIALIREQRRCRELESHLTILETASEEFRTIRHQYNNMFQSVVFYIENEQRDADRNFVTEIMNKTSELNRNSTLQLIKIKNRRIRSCIGEMAEICKNTGITLNIAVFGEVSNINMHESTLSSTLYAIFDEICEEIIAFNKKEINIEINSDNQRISIIFDSYFEPVKGADKWQAMELSGHRISLPAAIKRIMTGNKNVVYNSYIDNDYHRQEIMIM